MTTLPLKLTVALGQYFLNYQLSQPQNIGSNVKFVGGKKVETKLIADGRPWDKMADLARIRCALPKGWNYQAVAGTFWVIPANKKKVHYYTHQEIWPMAEVRPNAKKV